MKAGLRLPLGRQREEAVIIVEELGLRLSLTEGLPESVPVRMVGGRVGEEGGIPDL
jgi:hypothetical protein